MQLHILVSNITYWTSWKRETKDTEGTFIVENKKTTPWNLQFQKKYIKSGSKRYY